MSFSSPVVDSDFSFDGRKVEFHVGTDLTACLDIAIMDDDGWEGDEIFIVHADDSNAPIHINPTPLVLAIQDPEGQTTQTQLTTVGSLWNKSDNNNIILTFSN